MITKGEWYVDPKKQEGGYFVSYDNGDGSGESLAFIYPIGKDTKANAHLIATAPRMYEKLIKVCAWLDRLVAASKKQLLSCRFGTLQEALKADIKNYESTRQDLYTTILKAEGKEASMNKK